MRLERADRLRRVALQQYRELANYARFYGLSHAELMDRERPILDAIKTCPEHSRAYVAGFRQRIIETWHETELVYCHKAPDGTLYSGCKPAVATGIALDVGLIYRSNRGHEIPTWESAHYWLTASVRELSYGRPAKVY